MGVRALVMAWMEWSKSGGEETGQEVRKDAGAVGTGLQAHRPLSSLEVK